MGKSLNGKELGKGISQRKDGLYQGRFVNRFGKKQTVYAKTLNEVRQKLRNEQYEDEKYAGFYNVGPDDCDCVTTGQLVDLFCEKWGEGLKWVNQYDGGPHEANFLKLDCSKIKSVFGWRPRWGVAEAIEKTVEWSKIYYANGDIPACMDKQIKEFFE